MKKISLILLTVITVTSCSKKRTCTCLVTTSVFVNGNTTTSENVTRTYDNVRKGYAKQDCSDRSERGTYYMTTYSGCKLN